MASKPLVKPTRQRVAPIVMKPGKGAAASEGLARHAARGMWAAGVLFLAASLLDLVVLWGMQRQSQPLWEYQALANTVDGLPGFALAAGFMFGALYIGGSGSLLVYRLLGLLLIGIGLAGAAAAALMTSDYFILVTGVGPDEMALFRSVAFKTIALGGLHTIVLLPLGVLGMRRPTGP